MRAGARLSGTGPVAAPPSSPPTCAAAWTACSTRPQRCPPTAGPPWFESHVIDLELGYTTVDWPTGYVTWALDETIATLVARNFPVARFEATDLEARRPRPGGRPAVGTAPAATTGVAAPAGTGGRIPDERD